MITFGNPFYLVGLLTIGIPIYLHLYYRKKPLNLDFPSLRLIRMSVQAMVRRSKLKNLILLLLRILILSWLILALAKPFWGWGIGKGGSFGKPSAFVVILDNSFSMGVSHRGISLFNLAKNKAIEIFDRMGQYDKASLVLLNDPGTVVFPQLTWDKSELKEAVRRANLSMAGTNLFAALQSALKLLYQVKAYNKSVYLITDMTANSWKSLLDGYDINRIDQSIHLILIPVGSLPVANLTMADVQVSAPIVLKGRPVTLWGTVINHSSISQKTRVGVYINGDRKHEEVLELAPGEKKRFQCSCVFNQEGINHVRMSIPADALPYDDSRHLAVKVLAPQKTLIIKPPLDRAGQSSRQDLFLKFALNPLARRENATFLVESRTAEEAQILNLSDYALIFLVNQRNLPTGFVSKLSQYIIDGGNLAIFLGPNVDPTWYNLHLLDNLGGNYILPGRLVKRIGNAVSKTVAYQMTDFDFGHFAFKIFAGDGNGDPGKAHIYEYYRVEPNNTALILARMNHGLPAILEEQRGQGRVLLVTFTATTEWTNWPLKPTFLPFIQQAALGMIGKHGMACESYLPNVPVSFLVKLEGLKKAMLYPPKGEPIELPIQKGGGGLMHFTTNETEEIGFYRVEFETDKGIQKEGFTINFPPEEGNLERIPVSKIPRFTTIEQQSGSNESFGEKISVIKEGRDVSNHFLLILLLTLFIETLVANISILNTGRNAP